LIVVYYNQYSNITILCVLLFKGVNVTNRVTPVSVPGLLGNTGHVPTPRIRFAEEDDIMPIFNEDQDEDNEFNELPRFGKRNSM
jgi:hypothetical protein